MCSSAVAETPNGFTGPTWYEYRDQSLNIDGKGSFDNPIVIHTPEELAQLSWLVNEQGNSFSGKVVVLGADIDLKKEVDGKQVSWIPIGRNSSKYFMGVFIGVNPSQNGWEKSSPHTISNMYLSASKSDYANGYGLFGHCYGFIGYLALDNVTINVTGRDTGCNVGSVCGTMNSFDFRMSANDSGKSFWLPIGIYAVSVSDASLTVGSGSSVGGIVGWSNSSGVAHSAFEGEITAASSTDVGGIAGYINKSTDAYDCAAKVNIKGGTNIGGVVGQAGSGSHIGSCVSSGTLTDGSNVGGICGKQLSNSKILGCSSAADVNGSAKVGGITGWCGESDTEAGGTYAKIVSCVFTGHIRPTGSSYAAGGICGTLQWIENEHIDRCLFAGRIDDPANRKDTEDFGLILGKNSKPHSTVGGCYIDQSVAGSGKETGKVADHVNIKFLPTQQLITGNPDDTPLLGEVYDGIGFLYQAGFYPRAYRNDGWQGDTQFSAGNCSEACRKLFNSADMLKDNTVFLPQSWLCSVPVVIRKGDCAGDFVSTAEVKRTSTTFELGDKRQMKLRSNCIYPKTTCIDVKDDVVSAIAIGRCVLTYTASETSESAFDRPKAPQAVKELQFDVILSPWDGTVATACAAGTGTVDDPFIIKTGAQLAYAIQNNKENEFYEQICDITLNEDLHSKIGYYEQYREWIPNKWSAPSWKANYDGAGHFVSGAYIQKSSCGLFGTIEATGSVANLGIIDARGPFKGGLFAGVMNGTITNCIAQGEVSGIDSDTNENFQAGGICAIVGNGNDFSTALVEDCITAVSSGYFSYADYTPFVRLSNDNKGTVRNCLCVVPMTHLDADYKNSGITASDKGYIKDCYWLKGYEEVNSGYTLEKISELLGSRERWQATTGYFPTLKTFAGSDIAKLLMVPFRSDVDYQYDAVNMESDNYLFALGRQVLFEPGVAVWSNTSVDQKYIEVDTDMGVVVPMKESYDPNNKWDEFNRRMPGIVYISAKLGKAQHHIPVRARRNNVNAGISFEDENARAACLAAFDTDHNNVLSLAELKAATNAQTLTAFQTPTARKIKSFPEFRFFKNITELTSQLNGLSLLEKVQLPYALQTLGAEAFKGCNSLNEVTIPSRMTAVKPGAFYDSKVENILVDPFNETFTSRNGVLFTKQDGLVAYPNGRTGEEATIEGTVASIAAGAFYKVPDLRKLFFDTTDYTTVPEIESDALVTEHSDYETDKLMQLYVSDATYDQVLLNGCREEQSWKPYFAAGKVHQYFPLKISPDVYIYRNVTNKYYIGTFYIGFPTLLPDGLEVYAINSTNEDEYKAYYYQRQDLVPGLQPVMVIAKNPGTYRLTPVEGEIDRWPVYTNRLIGVDRDGMDVNQSTSAQGSIMTPQMSPDRKAGFYYEKNRKIEPYHCYLPYNTIDRDPEIVKNAHYDLVEAESTSEKVTEGDFDFWVTRLLPDGEPVAELSHYNGMGGRVTIPGTLTDGTPVTQIYSKIFGGTYYQMTYIDMTAMEQLDPIISNRSSAASPLFNVSSQAYVYLPSGKATPSPNTIIGDQCSELQLREGYDFSAPYNFYARHASYDRTFSAIDNGDGTWTSKAYSVCLPFTAILEQCVANLEDVSLYYLYYVDTKTNEFVFTNDDSKHLAAGHPYVLVVHKGSFTMKADANDNSFFFDNDLIEVAAETSEEHIINIKADGQEVGTGLWRGTYRKYSNDECAEMLAYIIQSDGCYKRVRNDEERFRGAYVGTFRAIFTPDEPLSRNSYKMKYQHHQEGGGADDEVGALPTDLFDSDGDMSGYDDETSIHEMKSKPSSANDAIYDLQGRPLNGKPTKGLYIHNGKKVIIK